MDNCSSQSSVEQDSISDDSITEEYSKTEWIDTLFRNAQFLNTPTRDEEAFLGGHYLPSDWDVICGRGRHSYKHVGNRRFRVIIAINLQRYINANSQFEKAVVVNSIVDQIRENSPLGGFVKQDSQGDWYEIGSKMARHKVGHAFRDCMTGKLSRRKNKSCSKDEEKKELIEVQKNIFRSCGLYVCQVSMDENSHGSVCREKKVSKNDNLFSEFHRRFKKKHVLKS